MEKVIAALAPLGLVVAFSPVPIIALITVLFSTRARVNGPAFLVGWIAGLSLVGGLLLGFGVFGGASANQKPSLVVQIIKLASMSPLHWKNPTEFDPDRYNAVPLTSDDGETRAKAAGLAKCPFDHSEFRGQRWP